MQNIETTGINGLTIVQRIDDTLAQKKQKRPALIDVGIKPQTISGWSVRGTVPPADAALRIAKYLGVSVEWLITGHEPEEMSADERRLLSMYRELDVRDREDVLGIVEGKVDRAKNAESQAV